MMILSRHKTHYIIVILNVAIARRLPTSAYAGRAVVVVVLAHQALPLVAHGNPVTWVTVLTGAHRTTTTSVARVRHARLAHRVPVGALARVGAVGPDLCG